MDTVPMTGCCPKCGGPLPADAPQGLCAKCLLAAASAPTESGSPGEGRPAAPSVEAVSAAFPQLEIIELLGHGGMGVVFKARQPKLDRFVALKLLPHGPGADPAFAERFNREARVLARLNHPGIVTVYDFGRAGEFFFLMMEYVDGVNLRQAMQAGRFTPAQALALVPRICEALQYAHDEGILHRDIKPENILLDTRGRVKIADFGIAKLIGDTTPASKLTASGAAVGTPHYMAPEQLESPQDVDQRADVYSLGVVFYELLTGELPIGRFAPPSEKSPVDPRVDPIVFRALEKERTKRFGSAGEVKTRVEGLTSGAAPPAAEAAAAGQPVRFKPSVKPIVMLGLVVAMVGLIINTVGPAGLMIGSTVKLATSSASGALVAALAAAGFGLLIWLTSQWRNQMLTPVGLGPVSEADLKTGGDAAAMDLRLHRLATIVLFTAAVFGGTRLVIFLTTLLQWWLGTGWIGYALLTAGVVALFLTRRTWKTKVSAFLHLLTNSAGAAAPAAPPLAGPGAQPPLLASQRRLPPWPLVAGLVVWVVVVPALLLYWFFGRSGFNRPVSVTRTAERHVSGRAANPESLLRALPVAEQNRQPGQTVFQWKCTVPARHVLLFRLTEWSSNGVPTVLDNLSSFAVAGSDKPVDATFEWSLQDGARVAPERQGQQRWDCSVRTSATRLDNPPVWTPKESPAWAGIAQNQEQKFRVYPGALLSLPMFTRTAPDVESKAIEAQVTLEPLGPGLSAGRKPRLGMGTNWLEAVKQKPDSVAENPEPGREPR